VALRARAPLGERIAWSIDGRPVGSARFRLVPGTHRIVARTTSGAADSVTVRVD
jgi:hypothetical protein